MGVGEETRPNRRSFPPIGGGTVSLRRESQGTSSLNEVRLKIVQQENTKILPRVYTVPIKITSRPNGYEI